MPETSMQSLSVDSESGIRRILWSCMRWTLFGVWVAAGILGMAHVRAGLFTSYAADVTVPAWLYIVQRTAPRTSKPAVTRLLAGAAPWTVAACLFLASAATEVSQLFWPRGIFRGTFDPLDIAAYAAGLGLCLLADLRWPLSRA